MLVPLVDHAALGYEASLPADLVAAVAKLGLAGPVQIQLPPQTRTEAGLVRVKPLLRAASARVGPFKPSESDIAVLFLDQGALSIYFDVDVTTPRSIEAALDAMHGIPPQRIAVLLHERSAPFAASDDALPPALVDAITALRASVGTVLVSVAAAELHGDFLRSLRAAVGPHLGIGIQSAAPSVKHSEAARLHRHDMQLVYPSVVAMSKEDVDAAEAAGRLDLGTTLAACARSDRADRLFATVVNDECGRTLGLVYSSYESIVEAVRCGRGVYFSRSRCVATTAAERARAEAWHPVLLLPPCLQRRPVAQGRHERSLAGAAVRAARLRLGRAPLHGQADGHGTGLLSPQHAQLLGRGRGPGGS